MEKNIAMRLREEIARSYGLERGSMAAAARDIGEKGVQGLSDFALGRKRVTAEVLERLAPHGIDVQYVVTGVRSAGKAEQAELPAGITVSAGQALLTLKQWAKLFNMRREIGQGRDLLWGPTLLKAVAEFSPADPVPIVAQRFTQQAKHGRTREALALYLIGNQPSAPWFIWPSGAKLEDVYSLDLGYAALPLMVPELVGFPSPALALEKDESSTIALAGHVVCEPDPAGCMKVSDTGGAYSDHAGRVFSKAFAPH